MQTLQLEEKKAYHTNDQIYQTLKDLRRQKHGQTLEHEETDSGTGVEETKTQTTTVEDAQFL